MLGFFPIPYPDELLYGVVARLYRIMGEPPNATFAKLLFGSQNGKPGLLIPKYFERIVKQLPPNYPLSPTEIRNKHTLAPLFEAFREKTLPEQRQIESTHLYSCQECRQADEKVIGEAYWHRSHQVPFGRICHAHGIPLQRALKEYKSPDKRFRKKPIYFLPRDTEWNPLPPLKTEEQAVYLRFHKRVQAILTHPTCLAPNYRTTILAMAQKTGMTSGQKLLRGKLHNHVIETIGESTQTLFQLSPNPAHARRTLKKVIEGRATNPLLVLLLYESFQLKIGTTFSLAERPKPNATPKLETKERIAARQRHRQTFLNLLKAHPTARRTELALKAPSAHTWLRINDQEWLGSQTAHIPRGRKKIDPRAMSNDALGAGLIKKAIRLLQEQQGIPRKVTTHSLCQILPPKEGTILWECRNCPRTQKMLGKHLDTDITIARKRIAWRIATTQASSLGLYQFYKNAGLRTLIKKSNTIKQMVINAHEGKPWDVPKKDYQLKYSSSSHPPEKLPTSAARRK